MLPVIGSQEMGEVDTKSIEPVQSAICLFGEKSEQLKTRPAFNNLEKEELENLLKDLSNFKFQLEAKNSCHKQTLVRLDHYEKTADELFILLKKTELERDVYMNDCREVKGEKEELELKIQEMDEKFSEVVQIREENVRVLAELESTKEELVNKEVELVEARGMKIKALKEAEVMESALEMQKVKSDELLGHVSELNETILHLEFAVLEAQKEKDRVFCENQAELLLATKKVEEMREELELMRNEMKNLGNEVLDKSLLIESMNLELQQAYERQSSAEKATSEAINDISQLISDMELLVKENSSKDSQINALEMELSQLRLELQIANKEEERLKCDIETFTSRFEKLTNEANEICEKESEAQIEIALLKSEVHRGRSKTAAAEAAEARANREKSALELVIQQLSSKAAKANNELQALKDLASQRDKEQQTSDDFETDEAKTDECISISLEEYEALVKDAEKANEAQEANIEIDKVKREMEMITARIGEFRTRAEQAVWRAEVAEKAKALLEEEKRKWTELEGRRKVAFEALKQESITLKKSFRKHPEPPKIYQPLGKILKMKF